jgi:SP family galactose:H+ symporter-like MFS transporter
MKDEALSEVRGLVYVAVGVAAIGGLLFGYDTGVISGAILFIKHQFSLSAAMEEIVVSSVLAGAVVGSVLGGALTDRFVRRTMIMLAGIIFGVSAACTALAPTVTWLITARVVSGIGIGIASFISPMYIAALVPAKVRGAEQIEAHWRDGRGPRELASRSSANAQKGEVTSALATGPKVVHGSA